MISLKGFLGKPLMGLALLAVLVVQPQVSQAGEAEDYISRFAERAVAEVIEPQISEPERNRRILALIRQHMDAPTVARFVLGRHWRRADAQSQQDFIGAFEASLAYNLLVLLKSYTGESLVVEKSSRGQASDKVAVVTSRLLRPLGEAIAVDWRLKRVGDGYRIIDVATEGVSMAITLRAEYSSFLKRQGDVAALAAAIQRRLATAAVEPAEASTTTTQ